MKKENRMSELIDFFELAKNQQGKNNRFRGNKISRGC